jgi:signal transduction histidine kinase
MLQKNNMKIIELINHASHFAQLESLKTVDMEKINLSEIASEVLVDLDAEIREREISVANLTRGPCVALANPLIREVFLNFLSNAIKYSPEKSKITIDIKDTGDVWKIMVIDSGEGISGKDKMRVFERFIRVNHVPVKGMGIGLAIVKRIIDFHGGEVGVEDNPEGKGSIFWATVGKA